MQRSNQARTDFETSLDDDLNTAEALAAIFEYIRDVNSAMDSAEFQAGNVADAQRCSSYLTTCLTLSGQLSARRG